jgi:hypothetical protein
MKGNVLQNVFLHKLAMKVASQRVVDEAFARLVVLTLGLVLEHHIVVPSNAKKN